jgi:hypothetical protein
MILQIRHCGNEWQHFETLARQLTGDPVQAAVLAAIANAEPAIFVVHAEARVKLTLAGLQSFDAGTTPNTLHRLAAEAVRQYAIQLAPVSIPIESADSGRRERYLHALTVGDSDDDLRPADDTPVELTACDGHTNPGYVAGLSRDLSLLYVAFEHEVLPTDLPGILRVHRNRT